MRRLQRNLPARLLPQDKLLAYQGHGHQPGLPPQPQFLKYTDNPIQIESSPGLQWMTGNRGPPYHRIMRYRNKIASFRLWRLWDSSRIVAAFCQKFQFGEQEMAALRRNEIK